MCAGRLSRWWKWQSLDSLKLGFCSERSQAAELSTATFSMTRKKSKAPHISINVCFLASLFSLQGRKCYCLAYSPQLPSQYLFYMQGLKYWVKDQGKIKSHPACPATCYSTLQQERPSQTQGRYCVKRERKHKDSDKKYFKNHKLQTSLLINPSTQYKSTVRLPTLPSSCNNAATKQQGYSLLAGTGGTQFGFVQLQRRIFWSTSIL